MADDLLGRLSDTNNPYVVSTYTPAANERNTLTITDYFKLLAAQLANQNMTNPMDNSEMMAQMTQVAMVQVVSAMTESVQALILVSTQVYAAGFVGQEITVVVTGGNAHGQPTVMGVQYGEVESVDFTGSTPVLKLVGDDSEYPLSYILGVGKIDDPYKENEDDGKQAKENDAENEGADSLSNGYAVQGGNSLTGKDIFT